MNKGVLNCIFVSLALGLFPSWLRADEPLVQAPPINESRVLILKPRKEAKHADVAKQHAARKARVKHSLPLLGNLQIVELPADVPVPSALAAYRASGQFEYVEPDSEVHILETVPNDPFYTNLYGMVKIQAPLAWDIQTNATDVVVAIIDTGISSTHPDLLANLWVNPNDGTHGYRFSNGVESAGAEDDHGHGTHVAGTIGAVGNNALGVPGCNWGVQLMGLKFLNAGGSGFTSDALLAFNKVLQLKQSGVNIRVTNNSWGGGGASQALADAMSACEAAGVLNVVAAGNSGLNIDASPTYPASYPNRGLLCVGASDSNDVVAGFSNRGLGAVDIMAPGVSIYSTVPSGACSLCDPTGYRNLNGTSMATPHVAGVAAALLHVHPELSAYEARDVILHYDSYDDVADPATQATSTGGRLNFFKTLTNPYADNPVLNQFPTVNPAADQVVAAGQNVSLSVTGNDPDGDPLRALLARMADFPHAWLMGRMTEFAFPAPTGGSTSFAAPTLSLATSINYLHTVADDRGGSAVTNNLVTVLGAANAGVAPIITGYSVSPTIVATGTTVWITLSASDSDGGPMQYSVLYGGAGLCCLGANTTVGLSWSQPASFRLRSTVMDNQLHSVGSTGVVVKIGGATNEPPVCVATLNTYSGPSPLTVQYNTTGSYDPDGTITRVASWSDRWNGVGTWNAPATGAVVYNQPGNYWLSLDVEDNQGARDSAEFFITVLAPTGGTPSPQIGVTPTSLSQTVVQGQDAAGQSFEVWNAGGGTLSYSVSDDATWLSVAPGSGTSAGEHDTIQVSYATSALAAGNYSALITVADPAAANSPRNIAVSLRVNGPPVANPQNVGTLEDQAVAVTLTGSDPNGDALSFSVVTNPSKGTLSGVAPNLTYTPNTNANGADSFTFRVSDGQLNSANATVSINITAVNDPPVANGQSVSTLEDKPVAITLTGSDPEGNALSFGVVTAPTKGALSGVAPNLIYTPGTNTNGADSFTFRANDGQSNSAPVTVSITVTAVNDAPSFTLSGTNVNAKKNAANQSVANWATNISVGPANEAGQTMTFTVTNNNTGLFATQPAISSNGTLSFRPTKGRNGVATVSVFVKDNGGTANSGVDQSATRTFTITVQ